MKTGRITHAASRAAIGALCGLIAAAVALGVAQLVAGFIDPDASPVVAVGGVAVNLTPEPLKEFAIAHFGTHDKQVLVAGILVVLAVLAAVIGIASRRRIAYGYAGLAVFAGLGVAAAVTRPTATAGYALPPVAGALVAAVALTLMVRAAAAAPANAGPAPARAVDPAPARAVRQVPDRRRFLLLGAGAVAVAAAAGAGGQLLLRGFNVSAIRAAIRLPGLPSRSRPSRPELSCRCPASLPSSRLTPSFYRVDTDIVLPQVSPDSWRLRVHGMVTRELDISFDELLHRPLTEADITLVCVSNQVGGSLNGNARWLGASLARLLRDAGVHSGADQILSTSTEGMTISTPLAAVIDNADAMIAVGMNGVPLPVAHGFPARMMVPGLYGYCSGTKWVTDLNLTTFAAEKAYWTQRGYAEQARIKTMARIDVPRPLQQIKAGRDGGRRRCLGASPRHRRGGDPGRRGRLAPGRARRGARHRHLAPVGLALGRHGRSPPARGACHRWHGATQTSRQVPPLPNGASGWDNAAVTVT